MPSFKREGSWFLVDISRGTINIFDYSTLEVVKNGFVISGIYAGKVKRFSNAPVVFSNSFPKLTIAHEADGKQ